MILPGCASLPGYLLLFCEVPMSTLLYLYNLWPGVKMALIASDGLRARYGCL